MQSINRRVSRQTSLRCADTGLLVVRLSADRHRDRRPEAGIVPRFPEVGSALSRELREAVAEIYREHPKQTHPTGMHTRVEIRERIYEHLAVFQ